jgi:hypothetical protein
MFSYFKPTGIFFSQEATVSDTQNTVEEQFTAFENMQSHDVRE